MPSPLTDSSPSQTMSVMTRRLITFGAFFAFFLFGFIDNLKGLTIPPLLKELAFTYAQGGTILFGAYIGFLVATLLTGPLSDVAGNKAIILIFCAFVGVGMLGYSFSSAYVMLIAAMTVLGFGLGCIEVGGNLIIVDVYHDAKGKYLSLLGFFHGFGSMVAPLYSGRMLEAEFSWRQVYQYSLAPVIFLLLFFLFISYPRHKTAGEGGFDIHAIRKSALTPDMLLFYAAIALYVAAEIGIASWSGEFLQKTKAMSVGGSSHYLAIYFGMLTAGRLVGSFLVDRVGYMNSLFFASAASAVCVTIGILGPNIAVILIPMTGFFFSIIFPTIVAAVSDLHKENVGTLMGVLFAFAGAGGAFGPWLIGVCNDWFGLQVGFSMVVVFCVLMTVTFLALLRIYKVKR